MYYEPATEAASILLKWLEIRQRISLLQLRRLTLATLMHWHDVAHYHGLNFTTVPKKKEDFKLTFPYNLIFWLYNSLSNGTPIRTGRDFEEQIGGFPPTQIDPVQHLVDYVTGCQHLRIELGVEQGYYKVQETVNVALTIENLTHETINFSNEQGIPVKFVAKSSKGIIVEQAYQTLKTGVEESDKSILLSPDELVTINWVAKLPEKGSYSVEAQVYVPHYEQMITLLVGVYYGVEPLLHPVSIRSYVTL